MKEIKRCQYQNCNGVITGRSDKKFCNSYCRRYAFIYNKRDLNKLKNEKKVYLDMIKEAQKNDDKTLIELYKMIYG